MTENHPSPRPGVPRARGRARERRGASARHRSAGAALPRAHPPRPLSVATAPVRAAGRGHGASSGGRPDRVREDGLRAPCAARGPSELFASAPGRTHRGPARARRPERGRGPAVGGTDGDDPFALAGVRRARGLPGGASGRTRGASRGARGRGRVAGRSGAPVGRGRDGGHGGLAASLRGLRLGSLAPRDGRGAARARCARPPRRGAPFARDGGAPRCDCGARGRAVVPGDAALGDGPRGVRGRAGAAAGGPQGRETPAPLSGRQAGASRRGRDEREAHPRPSPTRRRRTRRARSRSSSSGSRTRAASPLAFRGRRARSASRC